MLKRVPTRQEFEQMEAPTIGGVRVRKGNGETVRLARGASLTDFAEKIGVDPASLVQMLFHLGEMVTAIESVNDATLELLAGLPTPVSLKADHTAVTDAGVKHVHGLRSLEFVDVDTAEVTDAGAAALARALPRVTIRRRTDTLQVEEMISGLGGRVSIDRSGPGEPISTVNLHPTHPAKRDLARLASLPTLRRIRWSNCRCGAMERSRKLSSRLRR